MGYCCWYRQFQIRHILGILIKLCADESSQFLQFCTTMSLECRKCSGTGRIGEILLAEEKTIIATAKLMHQTRIYLQGTQ
jgi:hypothetical protein